MIFVSVTRLRLRSFFYVPQAAWHIYLILRQTNKTSGFLGGKVLRDKQNTFWTTTMWESEKAMRAYRGSGTHKQVMPHLALWCNEASVAHWQQEETTLLSWPEIHQRLTEEGRLSTIRFPNAAHQAKQFTTPTTSLLGRELLLQNGKIIAVTRQKA